ncbi:MAG: hypothetical protein AAGJ18_04435, partial [Bacteroidota bacterium]
MDAENLKQNSFQQEVREQSQAPTFSPDEIQDYLDRYDGFEELLAPLADNLERFSPEKKSKKRRFLQDEDTLEDRKELLDRLQAFVGFLDQPEVANHKQIRTAAQEKLDTNEALINDNLANILGEVRDLEQIYRELDLFYKNAAPQKVKNITLLNVHPEALLDADSNLVYNVIEKKIMDEARSVDQRKAYSLLVIPGLWKSKRPKDVIERYTKLAGVSRLSFLTDFADCDSVEDTLEMREEKKWQGFTGPELHHSKLIMLANHLILRGKDVDLGEEDDLRGSVAMAVAGKMYAEKISQPITGEMHGSLSGVQGLAYRTVQDEVSDLSEVGMNATMNAYDKDMVYNHCTAFDGAEAPLKNYPVVRTFDYVNRVLRHYLGKVTGQQLDRPKANFVRDTIQDFLNQLVEQKIISAGKVTHFDWNHRVPDRIDVNIDIQPLWAVRTFVYALKAKDRDANSELKEVK